ncbi:ATP-binding cassette domain-containing protein [Brachybacterium sp. GPGPB12]|uniref:ATP-binding cassette domain-containing protein n=1 Tax=Brachybacterium sp. GPGPB12 TaxID=3023517 RepID=UPI0031342B17
MLHLRGATLGPPGPSGRGEDAVLTAADLEIRAGRLLAVVGRNGAGKSTLLGALSRLDPLRAGTLEGAAAGLVLQRPESQFVADTVEDELSASGASHDVRRAMLERLDLADHAAQSPYRLSGGQQRRLSLGAMRSPTARCSWPTSPATAWTAPRTRPSSPSCGRRPRRDAAWS